MKIIERMESEVRGYCRSFPTIFTSAEGSIIRDHEGRDFIDFFAGAGALNYGHNNPYIREALLEYITSNGVTHALDMTTAAKCEFLESFENLILKPRQLDYKVMFPGPTGTNAVEAALKLARKVTQRTQIVAFTNAFHGMTLGSLALTGNQGKRDGGGVPLNHVTRMPYDGYMGDGIDTIDYISKLMHDNSSGIEKPAAFIIETVQAEGGVNVASATWVQRLAQLAKDVGAMLIIDDIQVGCGRAGAFFSFEEFGIKPDMICLSKSLSGYGLPFSLTLMRPELDVWNPGEHNGTFRGYNHAFVTANAALRQYWQDTVLQQMVQAKSQFTQQKLQSMAEPWGLDVRAKGLIQGLAFANGELASRVSQEAFQRGLIVETSGANDEVVKLLPPLTITEQELTQGLDILEVSVNATMTREKQ